jgi:hypothetical protein
MTKDTQTMHTLLQYQVLSNSLDLARILIHLGSSESRRLYGSEVHQDDLSELEGQYVSLKVTGKDKEFSLFYEPAYQLGLDMLKKLKSNEDVVYALLNEGLLLRAIDYAQDCQVHSLKLSHFI